MSSHQRTVSESAMGSLSFFTLFVIGTDTFLVAPLLPLLQEEFGVPLAQSGWLVSAYALGYALFALAAGPISDRHNRRRVLLAGVAAWAVPPPNSFSPASLMKDIRLMRFLLWNG